MDDPIFMYFLHGTDYRKQHGYCLIRVYFTFSFQASGECFALQIFHDDVSGIVFLEAIIYADNSGDIIQLCQSLRFIDKTTQTIIELLAFVSVIYSHLRYTGHTGRKLAWQIFFDCHLLLQQSIPTDICHAEAAVTQCFTDDKTLMQNTAGFHVQCLFCLCPFFVSAVRTFIQFIFILLHASHAVFHFFFAP